MIARIIRAAAAAGLETGDIDGARAYFRRLDPIVGWFGRRSFERRLLAAMAQVAECAASVQSDAHVLRLVALGTQRAARGLVPDDVAAVTHAYQELAGKSASPPSTARQAPLVTVMTVTALVVCTAAFGYWWWQRPTPSRTYDSGEIAHADAMTKGGVPLADPHLATALIDDLPALVIAADRAREYRDANTVASIAQPMRTAAWLTPYPESLGVAWRAALDAYPIWVEAGDDPEGMAVDQLRTAWRAFSYAMIDQGLGYYVELADYVTASQAHALAYSYRVERVHFVDAGADSQRVLLLRRLDRINVARSELGISSAAHGEPLVLMDNIDETVRDHVLPALSDGGMFRLGDDVWRGYGEVANTVMRDAAHAVRTDLVPLLGRDAEAAARVGALLAERARRLDRVRARLREKNITLRLPDALFMPDDYMEKVERFDVRDATLRTLEGDLEASNAAKVHFVVGQWIAQDVALHEAQHVNDARNNLTPPAEIEAWAGPAEWRDAENLRATRLTNETSAYLSELASARMPRLALWSLADWAFNQRAGGGIYVDTALLVATELAREAGREVPVLVVKGRVDRTALALVVKGLSELPADDLRATARRVWQRLFGRELSVATVREPDFNRR